MPAPSRPTRIPTHCHHKASNRGVVRLNGRDHYTGPWGTPEADAEYRRLIAEWLASHHVAAPGSPARDSSASARQAITVAELILAFWKHVQDYYRRPDGTPTGEEMNYKYALRPLRALYGDLPAADFTPLKLKAVRQEMIADGLARTVINGRVSRIVRMFRWGVAEELVPETVHRALAAVPNLQKGRSDAREPEPVRPVADEHIDAVLPFVTPPVRAMIELQRVTALRSGEVCGLRGADLDTAVDPWVYRPSRHKTLHHGKERVVFIGPRGQAVLRPWLKADSEAYLFSPREAMAAFRQLRRAARKSEVQLSQACRRKRNPRRQPGECYTFRSYGCAVRRAVDRANDHRERLAGPGNFDPVPHWHPHQIRHTRGTEVRKAFNLEGAQVALGHAHAKVTEVYAERDYDLARRIAADMG